MTAGGATTSIRPIDIIVPVYGAPDSLARCLESLGRTVDFGKHRVLLVLDGPQSTEVESVVAAFASRRDPRTLLLLRQARRRGYPAAVQRGMDEGAASKLDVVLLNSDTVVAQRWIENLSSAAYSADRIATVTPFTNNGTLASLPRPFEINRLPSGHDVEGFARLVERHSKRRYPRVPTAVGFCMLVKRAALVEIGGFDVAAFELGYGEEVDFCLRASAAGWEHCIDDATFVFHEGQSSFGRSRDRRVRLAERKIARRHPHYRARLASFMSSDPVAEARQPILDALLEKRQSRAIGRTDLREGIVHLVHGWPPENFAGTELYAWWLAHLQKEKRPVAVYTRSSDRQFASGTAVELWDRGIRVRFRVNHFDHRNPLVRNGLFDLPASADFGRFLDEHQPALVHVHHLAGHGFSMVQEVLDRKLGLILQLQDWWLMCARANLLDRARRLCEGPSEVRCASCLPMTRATPVASVNNFLSRVLYATRGYRARSAIQAADALVAGSAALVDSFRIRGWLPPKVPLHLVPYGVETHTSSPADRPSATLPLRLGFIGSLQPHKGLHVATGAIAGLPSSAVNLSVWGDPNHDPAYVREAVEAAQGASVTLCGRFAEEDRARVFQAIDVLIVPSLGLESYSLVAREALAASLPVIASDRGALSELFGNSAQPCGAHFHPDRPGELRHWIERLVLDPGIVDRWRQHAPRVPTIQEHAEALEPIYDQVLARKQRRD